MAYIIENATILKEQQLQTKSILIKENRIEGIQDSFKKYRYIKMNTEPFIITPSFVVIDTSLPLGGTFHAFKEYIFNQFLLKGCTTFITKAHITYEHELSEKISVLKKSLMSSPIDFLICVQIPVKLITPSFIRKCKKEKVSAIFVELQHSYELQSVAWSWIRDALFPYNSVLIPVIAAKNDRDKREIQNNWRATMQREKLPAIYEEIAENLPLSTEILNKIGIYNTKFSLNHGAEASYNLYLKSKEINNVDTKQLFLYHSDRLAITVHKGKVIRAGKDVLFKPGNGEYVRVVTPSYFSFS